MLQREAIPSLLVLPLPTICFFPWRSHAGNFGDGEANPEDFVVAAPGPPTAARGEKWENKKHREKHFRAQEFPDPGIPQLHPKIPHEIFGILRIFPGILSTARSRESKSVGMLILKQQFQILGIFPISLSRHSRGSGPAGIAPGIHKKKIPKKSTEEGEEEKLRKVSRGEKKNSGILGLEGKIFRFSWEFLHSMEMQLWKSGNEAAG